MQSLHQGGARGREEGKHGGDEACQDHQRGGKLTFFLFQRGGILLYAKITNEVAT